MDKVYTVYKITNNINNKYYIGVHLTNNPYDGYYGSGVAIKQAIKAHGKHNFRKEILFITSSKEEAYLKEIELTNDYDKNFTYNMRLGGVGGFTSEAAKAGAEKRLELHGPLKGRSPALFLTKEELRENGRKGGLKLKGKPKSPAHVEAMKESYKRRKQVLVEDAGIEPT